MNDRPPSINEPGQENLDRNILRNEIHVFLSETGWGIFNRNSGEISSGIDICRAVEPSTRHYSLPRRRCVSENARDKIVPVSSALVRYTDFSGLETTKVNAAAFKYRCHSSE